MGIFIKVCKYCGNTFETHKAKAEFCTHKCNQYYHDNLNRIERSKKLIETGVENIDYVIDKWSGLATPRIYGKWMKSVHPGKTSEDYKREFPGAPLSCAKDKENTTKNSGKFMKEEKYRKWAAERMKGDKNPNSKVNTTKQQRKERSPFSKEFYEQRNIDDNKRIDFIDNVSKNRSYTNRLSYYTDKGIDMETAEEMLRERQRTFTLEKCIERHGKEKGTEIFKNRQLKWKEKIYNTGKICTGQSYQCQELISKIFEGIDKDKKYRYINNEYRLGPRDHSYYYDITNTDTKRIIEYNGDYWHGNPELYNDDDIQRSTGLTYKEVHEKDEAKINLAKEHGFEVLVIWESDFMADRENTIQKCKEFILS